MSSQSKYQQLLKQFEASKKKVLKRTAITLDENPSQKAARVKRLEANYIDWFEYYLPHYAVDECAPYHKKTAKLLIENPIVYLVQRIFRGGAKSVHANVGIPLYLYLAKKELGFMLLIGENETKAKKLLSDIQVELQINERLKHDYGLRFKHGDWADGNFSTSDDVNFFALGIGQSPRGVRALEKRPDYISVDDVDTKKRCKNKKLVREGFEYLKEDIWGTFGKEPRRFVLSNNRFSKHSIVQLMSDHFTLARQEYKEKGLKPIHHIVIAKAINDKGESTWAARYPLEYWDRMRIDIGERAFQREYQDNPIEEGTVFKNEWMHYRTPERLSKYDKLIIYGDLSYKEMGDYKAMLLVGRIGKEFHIIKTFVRKTTRTLTAQKLYDWYEDLKLSKYSVKYLMEGSFAQDEFIADFDAEGDRRGYYVPVVADKKAKANKEERIESMSGYFERGNVFFNTKEKDTVDNQNLVDQLLAFEKGSKVNDDAPDALQSAIQELNTGVVDINISTIARDEIRLNQKSRY